jgi:hypothetical protein
MLLSLSETTVDRRGGLLNVIDVIVAPKTAFERLRVVPTWGWAFLVATLLGIAGSLLIQPAVLHAIDKSLPAQLAATPQIAKLPADRQAEAIAQALAFTKVVLRFQWLFVPIALLLAGVVQALALTIASAASHGDGSFGKFFALSETVTVVGSGLASFILALIVVIKGTDSFDSQNAVIGSIPSLALLVPGVKGALAGFLGALNIFSLWATALLAIGATIVGKVKASAAWTAAIVLLLLTAAFMAYGGAQQG